MGSIHPSFLASMIGQTVLLIWILSSNRQQISELTKAVGELKEAIVAMQDFRRDVEVRVARIENTCSFYHGSRPTDGQR